MKKYHSIPYWNKGHFDTFVYAFDKMDGSNMRFSWDRKSSKKKQNFGFNKFGTRNQMITIDNENWGQAIKIFNEKYAEGLDKIFREDKSLRNAKKVTVYAEYYGPNSFAGQHEPTDKMDLVLFDVDVYQKGFVKPKEFIKLFSHLGIPKVIYKGLYTEELIMNVKNNIYDLSEGVVVKGVFLTKKKGVENVWMTKIKTNQWLNKIKEKLGEKGLLEELNGDATLLI
jgi:hypothetical protein